MKFFAITPYFQVYAARPSFQLESQGPGLDHASPPASLFESLPSVEYTRLEQEFDALAGAGGEVVGNIGKHRAATRRPQAEK